MRYSKGPDEIGTKLGPKLVQLISQTIAATKLKLLDTEHRARVNSMQEIIDRAGRELADLYRPVLNDVLKDADMPDSVREFVDKAVSGTHQWQAIGGLAFQSSGAQTAISTILSNFLAPGVRYAVQRDPQLIPSSEELIQLGVKGTMDWGDVYNYAHGNGYADFTINSLRDAYFSYPDFATTIELLRRNNISIGDARKYLTRNGIPADVQDRILQLQKVPLVPADLADMVVRGILSQNEAQRIASESGVDSVDFDLLVRDTGEPLALEQLLEARRRGFIDNTRLVHGILQSRIRNEWVDVAEKLAYSPMSVADAVNAVVQNHMTQAEGERISQENGLEPGNFGILYETAGEPLSRTEMEQLYNRGLVTQSDVDQALRESRLKNKYINHAFQLHEKVPEIFILQHGVTNGAIKAEDAVKIAMRAGYTHADATWMVHAGSKAATNTYQNKVVAAIETMYVDDLMPKDVALSTIEGLGFSKPEAGFVLQAAEFRRMAKAVSQVAAAVKGRYLAHRITKNQAVGFLDAAGIPAQQRDYLIGLWNIDRDATTRTLTEAQTVKAVNKNLITPAEGMTRLQAMGYSQVDADLLIKGA
jgi:hypothetical protein